MDDLVEQYRTLVDRKARLQRDHDGVSSVLDQNERRVDAIKKQIEGLGIDPDKVEEYLEAARARLSSELDEFEQKLEASEQSVGAAKEAIHAIS